PLELSKLGSILGSFLRVFGLSIAARIDNCKVCRGTKNPRTYRAGSVKTVSAYGVRMYPGLENSIAEALLNGLNHSSVFLFLISLEELSFLPNLSV
ncbi:hypothetical protein, partial [Coleofasciculus sp. G2-EDA-02]|uniref:hypothetical protein n=1 Tax=Coleofasciculus sp. G2-EDA-02 TaxID=3069529 RepID=UPI0032F57F84